ncbi:hypothetical protein BDE36_3614 [Arcticibacter tournemirensis]|uniref:hypothetical protein n=1 Tax=Arcticibacter tournemirensis TaxID=699437 RepID=UPI0011746A34|nr:hypothetical protein [Arcticibacter tournemirensis]TQM51822.1 hypothetical protein BDE36_3614 [Arcticibacter tournemirensis]
MTKLEKQKELRERILAGLDLAYDRLIKFKKERNSELVVIKDGKIVKIKPE